MKSFLMTIGLILTLFLSENSEGSSKQKFVSAETCGSCHKAIYEGWNKSMHAQAVVDPIFYPIFLETSQQTGGKSDSLCLSCHSPGTKHSNKDGSLKNPTNQEGVACNACHQKPEKINSAELCATCHQYSNEHGAVILGTYTEWKESPQAKEGKVCQSCHMSKTGSFSSHEATGGHSADRIKQAVTLKLGEVKRADGKIHAIVQLENVGSGHKVPTGIPSRKLVLHMEAVSEGIPVYSEDRVYQKTLLDKEGRVITKDSDLFLHAAKVKGDNRLEPRKVRSEHFTFYAPEGKPIEIKANVYYLYQPRLIQETQMKVEMGNGSVVIPAK